MSDPNSEARAPRRRRFLAAFGGTALAGCTDALDDGTDRDGSGGNDGEGDSGSDDGDDSDGDDGEADSGSDDGDGSGGNDDSGNGDDSDDEPVTEMAALSENTDWFADDAPAFIGDAPSVTTPFEMSLFNGFVFEYEGDGDLVVEVVEFGSDEPEAVVVDEPGPADGAVGVGLPSKEYFLDVDANGDWFIELGRPFPPSQAVATPPAVIEGEGTDVYGVLDAASDVTFSAEHDGTGTFTVRAWDESASDPSDGRLVFEAAGPFEGETGRELDGTYYFAVDADGAYTVEIA